MDRKELGIRKPVAFFVFSRKMIKTGDRIPNILLRILYYTGLPVGSLAIAALVGGGIIVLGNMPLSNKLRIAAGRFMFILLFVSALFVFLIVPYLQTILVLLLRKILQKNILCRDPRGFRGLQL